MRKVSGTTSSYELQSKLLKGGYTGDHYRGYYGGYQDYGSCAFGEISASMHVGSREQPNMQEVRLSTLNRMKSVRLIPRVVSLGFGIRLRDPRGQHWLL